MILLAVYYILLLGGLATMLLDGLGWVSFVVYFGWMPLGAVGLWRLQGRSWRQLRPAHLPVRQSMLGVAGAAGIVASGGLLLFAGGWLDAHPIDQAALWSIVSLAAHQLVVAGFEELAFRGVCQRLLTARYGPAWGLAGASALFGTFHIPNIVYHNVPKGHIPVTVGALVLMGIILGWAYQRTAHNLMLPVALHFGWNVASFSLQDVLIESFTGPRWITGVTDWVPESGLFGLVGLASLGIMAWLLTDRSGRKLRGESHV
jgi:membrane protease YdiL (CAAX protease family)